MSTGIDRRTFIKGAGVATGVAATGAGAHQLDLAPVQDAEAIPPLVIGAGIAAGGVALGWALREFEVLGQDDPPEGLTADALQQQVYQIARTRESTFGSTITDNRNILVGIENAAYVEGKLAAIEALNNEESQSSVQDKATSAVHAYRKTVVQNFLDSVTELLAEFQNLLTSVDSHPDLALADAIYYDNANTLTGASTLTQESMTLDGDTYTWKYLDLTTESGNQRMQLKPDDSVSPPVATFSAGASGDILVDTPYGVVNYSQTLQPGEQILTDLFASFANVSDGLITWVESVYSQVQAGDIDVSDLITPRERAAMMTDDGKYPQAVADLLALNVPVDFEREATVSLDWHDDDVTLNGTLAITSPPDNLATGTYDPEADSLGSVYLTYDVGEGEGIWTAYDDAKGVDGGTVEFESKPYQDVTYDILTNYDETASVTAGDFTEGTDGSGNTVWTVDVSDQLDNSIAEISEVTYYTDTDETRYETIQMEGTFTIEKFTNTETGEQADSASFTSSEPQDDTNYVTQEEWDQLQQQNKELIEKYEDSQSGGGGIFPDTDIPGWGIVVAVGGIALILLGQSDDNGY
jgi:hypothetical protein